MRSPEDRAMLFFKYVLPLALLVMGVVFILNQEAGIGRGGLYNVSVRGKAGIAGGIGVLGCAVLVICATWLKPYENHPLVKLLTWLAIAVIGGGGLYWLAMVMFG